MSRAIRSPLIKTDKTIDFSVSFSRYAYFRILENWNNAYFRIVKISNYAYFRIVENAIYTYFGILKTSIYAYSRRCGDGNRTVLASQKLLRCNQRLPISWLISTDSKVPKINPKVPIWHFGNRKSVIKCFQSIKSKFQSVILIL